MLNAFHIIGGQVADGRFWVKHTPDDRPYVETNPDSIVFQNMMTYGYAYSIMDNGRTMTATLASPPTHEVADLLAPETFEIPAHLREDVLDSARFVMLCNVSRIKKCSRLYNAVDDTLREVVMGARTIKRRARLARKKYETVGA